VACSETRLMQVFIHLIANAAHAIEERNGGFNEIRIEVSERGADRASVTVRDTGVGMSPDTLGRLFTPFFSTKQAGRGTGLGLSVSRTIIDACGGRIHFESQAGQGTTATVELPVAPAPPAPPVAPESSGERGRILVIDDEPFVANALCRLLRSRGFQTDAATDGRAGRDKLLTGEYQAVLCDLMMPEYSGVDFYNDIEARRPDLVRRIIFLSGGAFTPTAEAFIEEGRRPVLPKPWSVKILISAIDDIE
jgi:CheY-like chemotaxis protein